MPSVKMPISIPTAMYDRMKASAAKRHQSTAEYIRSAVVERWEREEREDEEREGRE